MVTADIVTLVVPVLVNVTYMEGPVVPTNTLGDDSEVGETESVCPAASVPVAAQSRPTISKVMPENFARCLDEESASVIECFTVHFP
jgi:hypothetical protein